MSSSTLPYIAGRPIGHSGDDIHSLSLDWCKN